VNINRFFNIQRLLFQAYANVKLSIYVLTECLSR